MVHFQGDMFLIVKFPKIKHYPKYNVSEITKNYSPYMSWMELSFKISTFLLFSLTSLFMNMIKKTVIFGDFS